MKKTLWLGLVVGMGTLGMLLLRLPSHSSTRVGSDPGSPVSGAAVRQDAASAVRVATAAHQYPRPEAMPAWCIPYGNEFWKPKHSTDSRGQGAKPGSDSPTHPFDLGEVISRVSHSFSIDSTDGVPAMRTRSYAVRIQGGALQFSIDGDSNIPRTSPAPISEEQRLAALAPKTPETPEEEEALMAGIIALQGEKSAASASLPADAVRARSAREEGKSVVTFETASIRQAGRLLFSDEGQALNWAVAGNTAQAWLGSAAGLVQHFEARREGVAVTWCLQRAPSAQGDLVVEARLAGLTYAGDTSQGHHFADASGISRMRVGNVTIVDAAGATWSAPLQVTERSLLITVSQSILSQAAYPLAIDPIIGPEFGMDVPVISAAPAAQQNPAVAANGTDFLVVWEDDRLASASGPCIYGTRVTGNGGVKDPDGIAISPVGASSPAVAANGTGFLVVWSDGRNAPKNGLDIFGSRLSSSGKVLDPGGFAVSTAAGDQLSPAACSDGVGSFVVWQDGRNVDTAPDVYGTRVTSAGVVSDPTGIPIRSNLGIQASPAITFNGTNYLVVWSEQQGAGDFQIKGTRMSRTGVILDPNGLELGLTSGGEYFPKAAANGADFLVVWEDHRNEGVGVVDIFGGRITGAGSVLDRGGFQIGVGSGNRFTPAVASGLADYLVVWQDARNLADSGMDIYGSRVSTKGEVLDAKGIAVSTAPDDQSNPALAFNGSLYLGVWCDRRNLATTDADIYGTMISTGGGVASPTGLIISTGAVGEQHPVVASNGQNYLVAWQDYRNSLANGVDIFGVRVGTNGGVLDLSGILISGAAGDQTIPAVAVSGANYLVVWQDLRNAANSGADIFGTRVSSAGVVLDPNGIPISTNINDDELAPSVAGDGSGFLVVWQDGRNLANEGIDIYGARITAGGQVLDANGLPLCLALGAQYAPAVAFNGTNYLVVWSDERDLGFSGVDVYGTRVSPAGAVLDSKGIPISQTPGDAVFPAVASIGGGFLVVWEDGRNAAVTEDDIYGARVSGGGGVLDPAGIAISVAPGLQAAPTVTTTRIGYFVAWQDGRNLGLNGLDLFGTRVSADGMVGDLAGFPINNGPSDQQYPKLASGTPGVLLVVCQSQESGAQRAIGNLILLDDFPEITRIIVSGNVATLTWVSIPNRTYRVQFKPDLATLQWADLPGDVVANGPTATKVDGPLAGVPNRYYRVALLP